MHWQGPGAGVYPWRNSWVLVRCYLTVLRLGQLLVGLLGQSSGTQGYSPVALPKSCLLENPFRLDMARQPAPEVGVSAVCLEIRKA